MLRHALLSIDQQACCLPVWTWLLQLFPRFKNVLC